MIELKQMAPIPTKVVPFEGKKLSIIILFPQLTAKKYNGWKNKEIAKRVLTKVKINNSVFLEAKIDINTKLMIKAVNKINVI